MNPPPPPTTLTCASVGIYSGALTRGRRRYELLGHDREKRQVRVRDDGGRARWFPESCFTSSDDPVPTLAAWRFTEPVGGVANSFGTTSERFNWVEAGLDLSDGTYRTCSLTTPDFLKVMLEHAARVPADVPGVWGAGVIVVHDLTPETVGRVLHHLDQQGELVAHSLPTTYLPAS